MKKNIIIAGVPRAGKSTAAHMLAKATGYPHISMDAVIAGFEAVFPNLGVHTDQGLSSMETFVKISGLIAPFMNAMMESDEYDKFHQGMILDVYQLLPKDYAALMNPDMCDVYYLGTADVTAQQRLDLLLAYDTPQEYTYEMPLAEKRENCADMVEQSRMIRRECRRLGFPYYETSFQREETLNRLVGDILRTL